MKFFTIFDKMDRDHSGEVSIDEFFQTFELDWSSFGKHIFAAMDASGDNRVEFAEFFVGLWNYCTLDRDSLVKFAFDMFDLDGSGSIDVSEFKQLIHIIHGDASKQLDAKTEHLLKVFDRDHSGTVTLKEFTDNVRNSPSLMMKPFTLQKNMREQCMGNSYWKGASKRRRERIPDGQDLISLHFSMYHHNAQLDRHAAKEAAQGKGVGFVNFKGMSNKSRVAMLEQPSESSKRVAKLFPNECVIVSETMETGGRQWYRIEEDTGMNRSGGWVLQTYIQYQLSQ